MNTWHIPTLRFDNRAFTGEFRARSVYIPRNRLIQSHNPRLTGAVPDDRCRVCAHPIDECNCPEVA